VALTKIIAAGILAFAPLAAHAQIADGGFEAKGSAGTIENGGAPVNRYCYDGMSFGNGSCASTATWNGSGVVASHNGDWGGTAAQSGDYFAFVQGSQTLSQSFTIGTGGSFDLSWFDAGRTNNGGPQSYTVSLFDGLNSIALGTFTTDHFDWIGQSSGKLALGAGNYTLTFQGLSNEDRTAFIDNVSVAGVPEPAAWGMLIGGFGLAGAAMRRRRGEGSLSAA
jgi:hypothetical protein